MVKYEEINRVINHFMLNNLKSINGCVSAQLQVLAGRGENVAKKEANEALG